MIKGGDLTNMFNRMLGIESADPEIVGPKFILCRKYISMLSVFMEKFATFPSMRNICPSEARHLDSLLVYSKTLAEVIGDQPITHEFDKSIVAELYLNFKNNESVKTLFIIYSQLKRYKKYTLKEHHKRKKIPPR